MGQRATVINLANGTQRVAAGEPLRGDGEDCLVIQYDDGTSRVFNWAHVSDYYYMTEEEFAAARGEEYDD